MQAALEAAAAALLPKQVVPHRFWAHECLPLAPGGKVDRQALQAASEDASLDEEALGFAAPASPLVSPLEVAVARAWAAALGRSEDSFGANSNFFWLRGDSLSALRACRALRNEVKLPEDSGEQHAQQGEAGLLVPAEAPEGALCILSAALGALAPCELLARPTLGEYAAFLAERGVRAVPSDAPIADGIDDSGGVAQGKADTDPGEDEATADSRAKLGSECSGGTLAELALSAAAREGRLSIVRTLLQAGTSPEGPVRGNPPRGFTPLHSAAASGQAAAVEVLLAAQANPRAMTQAFTSPAHLAAAQGDSAVLQLLLADREPKGIATWARDADQQTIVHLAARSGDVDSLKVVLGRVRGLRAKDGGLEARDRWGRTALQWAVANGHESASVALMKAGAFSGGIPEALLADFRVARDAPSRPVGAPVAARKVVQSSERICALVQSLPSSTVCQEQELFALTALRDFCCAVKEHREYAVAHGAIPKLLALLRDDITSEVVAAAAQTMRNIAADRAGASSVREAGGIPVLVALAALGGDVPAAWRAGSALVNLAEWEENVDELRSLGVAEALRGLSGQVPASLDSEPKAL
ncbi:unnamed protein product [Polarella glacialis]|uniref:Carrier domain-containing protein n=1 Tax=Polarella glacialis TaxID=89957 RepID=A0A813KUN6_POLGL|nr:unnamed protein product [Polarella glacialis]CAE8712817.1 unnamed protein product [Polarella glacialis]